MVCYKNVFPSISKNQAKPMHTTCISHRHYVIFYMGGPKEQIMYYNLRNGLLCSLSLSTKLLYVYEKTEWHFEKVGRSNCNNALAEIILALKEW